MNPNRGEKPNLVDGEFDELRELISNGKRNFSNEVLETAEYLHPLNLKKSYVPSAHIATAQFLFRCHPCTEIGMPIQWYQIILDTVGGTGLDQRRSHVSDLEKGFTGDNLAKIKEEDKTNYQDSSLNLLESKGYICNHCKDSIFEED